MCHTRGECKHYDTQLFVIHYENAAEFLHFTWVAVLFINYIYRSLVGAMVTYPNWNERFLAHQHVPNVRRQKCGPLSVDNRNGHVKLRGIILQEKVKRPMWVGITVIGCPELCARLLVLISCINSRTKQSISFVIVIFDKFVQCWI